MSLVKYRVKEVASDFGMSTKEITEIVGKYFEKPRSNAQVLTEEQLNALFDHITQHRQIASIAEVYAVAPAAKKEEPKSDDMIPREELASIRQKVAAFMKADPENGKVRVKKWLTEHDAAGISKVRVKDQAALLAFLGGEQVA